VIEIPAWIQTFVLAGIALVVVIVPVKILWEMTKGSRDRSRKADDLAQRLKERFGAVRIEGGILGPHRIHLTSEGRAATVFQPEPDELVVRLEPRIAPRFPVIIRTRGAVPLPYAVMWESLRILRRHPTFDPLLDESIDLYATPSFGAYLRELALDGMPAGGKPTGLAESLVVLRRTPGAARFELRMSPSGGFRLRFLLRADDLLYRPDDLEAVVHHAFRLYDLLVLE
jgi:hypothetical protein